MQTYTECLASLFQEQHDKYHWKSSEIIMPIATSLSDSTPCLVNIADTIGFNIKIPIPLQRNDQTCYWMSPQLESNTKETRKKHLYPLLVKAGHEAGFKAACQYNIKRCAILVGCHRRLYHSEQKQEDSNGGKKACARKTQRLITPPPRKLAILTLILSIAFMGMIGIIHPD